MFLLYFLACDGSTPKDSDSAPVQNDSSPPDSEESSADESKADDSGDSLPDEPKPWAFSDPISVIAAVEPTVAPVYLVGQVKFWVQAGGEGPGCPAATDLGGGTVELDATACANGSVGGKIRVSGLPAANQIPDGSPFTVEFQNFSLVFGLYPVTAATGTMEVTFHGYDPSVHIDEFTAHFDGPPALLPGDYTWGGDYHYENYDASEGVVDFELTGLATGFIENPDYGRASVDVTYKYGSGSCSETTYYPGSGTWVGSEILTVTWDGDSDCDGCVSYNLAVSGAGEICGPQ